MKFFLDTANLEEIRTVHRWGILDGITTNPTLVSREGMDYRTVVREIASITSGPISVETTSDKADEMIQQGKDYVTWAPNVVVKVSRTAVYRILLSSSVLALSNRGLRYYASHLGRRSSF